MRTSCVARFFNRKFLKEISYKKFLLLIFYNFGNFSRFQFKNVLGTFNRNYIATILRIHVIGI